MRQRIESSVAGRLLRVCACCLVCAAMRVDAVTGDSGILATLSSAKTVFAVGEPVTLRVSVRNPGTIPVAVLKWHTPFFGIDGSLFEVRREGAAVAYLGRSVKRPPPVAADYLTLGPAERIEGEVDLAALYDLTVPGAYTVTYSAFSPQLFRRDPAGGDAAPPAVRLISNTLAITIIPARGNS